MFFISPRFTVAPSREVENNAYAKFRAAETWEMRKWRTTMFKAKISTHGY